jgi:hypothetical protein
LRPRRARYLAHRKKRMRFIPAFYYREQATLLLRLVREVTDPSTKSELLDIADRFLHLAESGEREPVPEN